MVERIVAAGREVLVARGYDAASTNRIAAAAGISPGSLYQYFPDKDAVIGEILGRHLDDLEARVSRAFLEALPAADIADAVHAIVVALLDVIGEQPDLHRAVAEQLPRTANGRRVAFARRIDELAAVALIGRGVPPERARVTAWTVVRTAEHVTTSYVLERPGFDREQVVEELTRMVTTHLAGAGLRPEPDSDPS